MKELRFEADDGVGASLSGSIRMQDYPALAGDQSRGSEKRFYTTLIAKADKRYQRHLDRLAAVEKEK